MSEKNDKLVSSDQQSIPELEALLRTNMGHELILDSVKFTNFLPPGENYQSLILKVDAVIRRKGKDSTCENLHMIAKVPSLSQQQRDDFTWSSVIFKKESFMYDTILPAWMKLEHDCDIEKEDTFDLGPAFYGSRFNLDFGDEVDKNAVILLENLNPRGYYSGNRYTGLDIHHLRMTVVALAKFHALGIATKTKNPEFFEVLKSRSKGHDVKLSDEWKEIMNSLTRSIKNVPIGADNYESCAKAMEAGMAIDNWSATPEEPWSTIIHGDFWINNILFHRNEETGRPDEIKFVDFQNYLFHSPLRELSTALGIIPDHDVSIENISELIDLYYETFITRIKIMGCDVSPFTREKFNERLSIDAYRRFCHAVFMLKIITNESKTDDPEAGSVKGAVTSVASDQFYARLRDLIAIYVERGWLATHQ